MVQFVTKLHVFFFFLFYFSMCLASEGLTLEDRLIQLTVNFVEMKELQATKMLTMVSKVDELERVLRGFEALELKVQEQELVLIALQNISKIKTKYTGKVVIPRTCNEAHESDPSLASGMYWVDPDGQEGGDDPIYVYCNMVTGSTSITHDSESQIDVGHCADPGCYSKTISYNATSRQIAALAELSQECHQMIKYDCIGAPFEVNGVSYSWWEDRNGNPQYFWAGSNTSVHTCQCGIDNNCVEYFMKCNCDSSLQTPLFDMGTITNMDILPISQLNFGRTMLNSSSGLHTLGRFECTGQIPVNGVMPSSCADLWRIGHTLSGLYSVKGEALIETVYCDFTKVPNDSGFETWIGYTNVKTSPTYFYVQRNYTLYSTKNGTLSYNIEKLNVGGAMNLSAGIFTAPRKGIYFFSFSACAGFYSTLGTQSRYVNVALFVNGNIISNGHSDDWIPENGNGSETLSLQSTISLESGDEVSVRFQSSSPEGSISDNRDDYRTHFTGWLLEEDIFSSLIKV